MLWEIYKTIGVHQWWAKWRLSTFLPLPFGGWAWGAGTNIWHPETPASYETLPAPLATQIPTLCIHTSRGRGRGGALILDRCRAYDLLASVDAHLWTVHFTVYLREGFLFYEEIGMVNVSYIRKPLHPISARFSLFRIQDVNPGSGIQVSRIRFFPSRI